MSLPIIKPAFHPLSIVSSPTNVRKLAEVYIHEHTRDDPPSPPMTIASFALHMGFASTAQLCRTIQNEDTPLESNHYLMAAITAIEAQMGEEGLADKNNVSMAKFLLSAQHDVVPKKEVVDPTRNQIEIVIEGVNTQVNIGTNPQLKDLI